MNSEVRNEVRSEDVIDYEAIQPPTKHDRENYIIEEALSILDERFRRGERLATPAESANYLKLKLADYPYEVFACLYLDNRHRVVGFDELFRGTVDGAYVHPR